MSDKSALEAGLLFDQNRATYDRLADEATFTLRKAIEAEHIKTHSITSRVKDRASYLEKIDRKGYHNPSVDIEDVVGVRIVCLFRSDLARLRTIVASSFSIRSEEDKIDGDQTDSFGYMSLHFICTLRPEDKGPRYQGLHDQVFEVQCRTILMDAWANVSHYLAYKGEASIPENLRRDFYALSGLFYVADRHFELFFGQSNESQIQAVEDVSHRIENTPLNRDTLAALIGEVFGGRQPADSWQGLDEISTLAEELHSFGYRTIESVREHLERAKSAALAYEGRRPPLAIRGRKFTAAGIARQALAIANVHYGTVKYPSEDFAQYRRMMPTAEGSVRA